MPELCGEGYDLVTAFLRCGFPLEHEGNHRATGEIKGVPVEVTWSKDYAPVVTYG